MDALIAVDGLGTGTGNREIILCLLISCVLSIFIYLFLNFIDFRLFLIFIDFY